MTPQTGKESIKKETYMIRPIVNYPEDEMSFGILSAQVEVIPSAIASRIGDGIAFVGSLITRKVQDQGLDVRNSCTAIGIFPAQALIRFDPSSLFSES